MKRSIILFLILGIFTTNQCFDAKAQDLVGAFFEALFGPDSKDETPTLNIGMEPGYGVGEFLVCGSFDPETKFRKNDKLTLTFSDNEKIDLYYDPEYEEFENTFDLNIINKLLKTNIGQYEINGDLTFLNGESAKVLKDAVDNETPSFKAIATILKNELPLSRLLFRPFGYTPRAGKKYTYKDVMQSANLLYNWKLQEWPDKEECGFEWPELNGMTVLDFPVQRIASCGPFNDYFIGFFYCEVAMYEKHKKSFVKSLTRYMKDDGWNVLNETGLPSFYKDNVMVEIYFDPRLTGDFQILHIDSQVFPSAADVIERIEVGVG